jgi:mono/diheme cytochrome c family protein
MILLLLAVGGVGAAGCSGVSDPIEPGSAHAGLRRFVAGTFGGVSRETLETNALPYKVMAAALLLDEQDRSGGALDAGRLPSVLSSYGFLVPERIANWEPDVPQPSFERPLGMVSAEVTSLLPPMRVDAVNLGCAACHAGVLYDARGFPTRDVWLGLPNTSLDLERYTRGVYSGLALGLAEPDRLIDTVDALYPALGWQERTTLRWLLMPRIRERMTALKESLDAPAPFSNGGPGRTNGVAALKSVLGLIPATERRPEHGYTSIPDLGWRGLRSSLLVDGFYAPRVAASRAEELAAIVTFFTVPTMGMHPATAEEAIPQVAEVMTWLLESYRPPPFPGPVDRAQAEAGREVYAARCASCHGTTSAGTSDVRLVSFPDRLSPYAEMPTSPARWQAIDADLVAAVSESAIGRHAAPRATGGYVAPILSGLWATAPYLHNGSVPTLWHLMHPRERPTLFMVGGHALDFTRVGIAYPQGYRPWSRPELYDTTLPGQENVGHDAPFEVLSEAEKSALLEYLKLL